MADERRDNKQGSTGRDSPGGDNGQGRSPNEGRRRFGRHRPFRGKPEGLAAKDQREARPENQAEGKQRELVACPLCGKPVYDLSTAVSATKEAGEPAHFDCVLERVAAAEVLAAGEKLVYLGSGAFGVVEFKDRNEAAFVVKRRIQWEKEGEKKEWRKSLSARIASL